MKSKWILAIVIAFCMLLVCAAIGLASWGSIAALQASGEKVFHQDTVSAERTDQQSFNIDGPVTLQVSDPFGDITVQAGQGKQVIVSAHKTSWDSTKEAATAGLDAMKINLTQTGNAITASYEPLDNNMVIGTYRSDTVDFTVSVPPSTTVTLHSVSGNITLSGTSGPADVHNQFGELKVSNQKGSLSAVTNSGEINASSITAPGETIHLESEFGAINLKDASAGEVNVKSNNGAIELSNVDASKDIQITSQFGGIRFTQGRANKLTAESQNGDVTLSQLVLQMPLKVTNSFGDISVEQVTAASFDLESSNNGKISLDKARGKIIAHANFGEVEIKNAEEAVLDIQTQNGAVNFSGSLGRGAHTIRSNFGSVHLTLPKDTALALDLSTKFGKIRSDFPLLMSGEISENRWKGQINNGADSLTITVENNGDITLEMVK